MSEFDYDLFVIGGGSGGVRAARIAAGYGARVGIAEEYRYGGTCVIRGCVPKKLLVYASHFSESFEDAVGFGWTTEKVAFDWPTLIANKDREIDRLNKVYMKNLEAAGVELFHSRAELRDAHSIRLLSEDRHVTAKYILVATGGTPNIDPALPGVEHVITSNEAFHLEELPERIVIAGGGYIAVEFACIFAGLGVDTTLVYRRDLILRGFDDDVRKHVSAEIQKKGVDIVYGKVFSKIEKTDSGLVATYSDNGGTIETDRIMFAIGRSAYTDGLGLEHAGVELTSSGAVKVDEYSKSNVDHIYAVGDVTDRVPLTPVAIREGHAFADTVFGGKDVKADHNLIPTAVFSQPEVGTVGLTEAEAREAYGDVDIYKSSFRPMKHTLSGRDEKMLMKLIVDAETDKVLGCHIVGPEAGEMAQLLGISLKMGATKADFDATMAVHPTASEELVTMRTKWSG
jgi:glutathione reductase (NADPH)